MWCPNCLKDVVFGKAGPEVLRRAHQGRILYGGRSFPAPCPKCGHSLNWERVLPGYRSPNDEKSVTDDNGA